MNDLHPRFSNVSGSHGEYSIDNYGVFLRIKGLKHVSDLWEATVAQCMILDGSHSHELDRLTETHPPDNLELASLLDQQRCVLNVADDFLVKANIFSLVSAFVEFGMLEVYKLVFEVSPDVDHPDLVNHILKPLIDEGVVGDPPEKYITRVLEHRTSIRAAFTDGCWSELNEVTKDVDLYDAFVGTIAYFSETEDLLIARGFDKKPRLSEKRMETKRRLTLDTEKMLRHEAQEFVDEILIAAPSDFAGASFDNFQYRLSLSFARSSQKSAEAYWMLQEAGHLVEAASIARVLLERMFIIRSATGDARVAAEILAADNKELLEDTKRWASFNGTGDQPPAATIGLGLLEDAESEFKNLLGDTSGQSLSIEERAKAADLEDYYYGLFADLCAYSHRNYLLSMNPSDQPNRVADFVAHVAPMRIAYSLVALGDLGDMDRWTTRLAALHERARVLLNGRGQSD